MNCYQLQCPPLPEGSTRCHCSRCHVTFGTLTDFEDHLVRASGAAVIVACTPPQASGLVQDETGTWRTPAGLASRDRKTALLAARRKPVPCA